MNIYVNKINYIIMIVIYFNKLKTQIIMQNCDNQLVEINVHFYVTR